MRRCLSCGVYPADRGSEYCGVHEHCRAKRDKQLAEVKRLATQSWEIGNAHAVEHSPVSPCVAKGAASERIGNQWIWRRGRVEASE